MKNLSLQHYFLTAVIVFLTACGGGGGGGGSFTPTDPNTVFRLLAPGVDTPGYSESYNLSGIDSDGDDWTASYSSQTQNQSTFLGTTVTPMFGVLRLTLVSTGGTISNSGTEYYEITSSGYRYIGFESNTSSTVSSTASLIPITAKIGDLGKVGTYIDNAGYEDVITWQLSDAGNGNANFIITSTERDQFGFLDSGSVQTTKISPDGTRLSFKISVTDYTSGLTINLSD